MLKILYYNLIKINIIKTIFILHFFLTSISYATNIRTLKPSQISSIDPVSFSKAYKEGELYLSQEQRGGITGAQLAEIVRQGYSSFYASLENDPNFLLMDNEKQKKIRYHSGIRREVQRLGLQDLSTLPIRDLESFVSIGILSDEQLQKIPIAKKLQVASKKWLEGIKNGSSLHQLLPQHLQVALEDPTVFGLIGPSQVLKLSSEQIESIDPNTFHKFYKKFDPYLKPEQRRGITGAQLAEIVRQDYSSFYASLEKDSNFLEMDNEKRKKIRYHSGIRREVQRLGLQDLSTLPIRDLESFVSIGILSDEQLEKIPREKKSQVASKKWLEGIKNGSSLHQLLPQHLQVALEDPTVFGLIGPSEVLKLSSEQIESIDPNTFHKFYKKFDPYLKLEQRRGITGTQLAEIVRQDYSSFYASLANDPNFFKMDYEKQQKVRYHSGIRREVQRLSPEDLKGLKGSDLEVLHKSGALTPASSILVKQHSALNIPELLQAPSPLSDDLTADVNRKNTIRRAVGKLAFGWNSNKGDDLDYIQLKSRVLQVSPLAQSNPEAFQRQIQKDAASLEIPSPMLEQIYGAVIRREVKHEPEVQVKIGDIFTHFPLEPICNIKYHLTENPKSKIEIQGPMGEFFKLVLGTYYDLRPDAKNTNSPPINSEIKRRVMAALFALPAGASVETQIDAILQNSGPSLQKVFQLVGDKTKSDGMKKILERLKSEIKPMEPEMFQKLKKDNNLLNGSIRTIVDVPLAVASIGEVHEATSKTGKPLVIKVKKPQVDRDLFLENQYLDILVIEMKKNGKNIKQIVDQLKVSLEEELDFASELKKLERVKQVYEYSDIMQKSSKSRDQLHIRVVSGDPHYYYPIDPMRDKSLVDKVIYFSDPKNRVRSNNIIVMDRAEGVTMSKFEADTPEKRCNKGNALAQLYKIWFHEALFGSGFFHGDLHGGNMLFNSPNGSNDYQLTMIDFGNATQLTPSDQKKLIKLIINVEQGDRKGILKRFGYNNKFKNDPAWIEFYNDLTEILNKNKNDLRSDLKLSRVIEKAIERDLPIPNGLVNFNRGRQFLNDQLNGAIKNLEEKDELKNCPVEMSEEIVRPFFTSQFCSDTLLHMPIRFLKITKPALSLTGSTSRCNLENSTSENGTPENGGLSPVEKVCSFLGEESSERKTKEFIPPGSR